MRCILSISRVNLLAEVAGSLVVKFNGRLDIYLHHAKASPECSLLQFSVPKSSAVHVDSDLRMIAGRVLQVGGVGEFIWLLYPATSPRTPHAIPPESRSNSVGPGFG